MNTIQLSTRANDNHGHDYQVELAQMKHGTHAKMDWSLRIVGAGGSWFMTTLENASNQSNFLYIDLGSNWYVNNLVAVMAEAKDLLAGEDRLTVFDVKSEENRLLANLTATVGNR